VMTLAFILSTTDAAPATISGPSAVEPTSRAVDSAAQRLCVKPSRCTLQLSFVRDVKALRTVSLSAAASADGHPSVGLGSMVPVEPSTYFLHFS
jgi:hypothetical protein